jgi:hypothetical protein
METMKTEKDVICVCEIYYDGLAYITKTKIEYKHTGEFYFYKKRGGEHILSGIDSAIEKKSAGKKIYKSSGHYIIDRVAIPTLTASGERDWWYINNPGDYYEVKRTSKYAKKIYRELKKEVISVF